MNINIDSELLLYFNKDEIQTTYEKLSSMLSDFIKQYKSAEITVNSYILADLVIDYYTSIKEIKSFHDVKRISNDKSCAYMCYWILRRKPIQIVTFVNDLNEQLSYINEKFVVSYIAFYLMDSGSINENSAKFTNFIDQMLYFFKYRDISVNTIELMIAAFQAGYSSH